MGIYEWTLLGVMFAVVIIFTVLAVAFEVRKNKKFRPKIGREILRVRARRWIPVFFTATGLIALFGGTAVLVCCSILIEPAPKAAYALTLLLMTLVALLCAVMVLYAFCNFTAATEEGVWAFRIFLTPKFFGYDDFAFLRDNTAYHGGGYLFFGTGGIKLFLLAPLRDKGACEMVALLRERAPRLKRWGAEDIFRL